MVVGHMQCCGHLGTWSCSPVQIQVGPANGSSTCAAAASALSASHASGTCSGVVGCEGTVGKRHTQTACAAGLCTECGVELLRSAYRPGIPSIWLHNRNGTPLYATHKRRIILCWCPHPRYWISVSTPNPVLTLASCHQTQPFPRLPYHTPYRSEAQCRTSFLLHTDLHSSCGSWRDVPLTLYRSSPPLAPAIRRAITHSHPRILRAPAVCTTMSLVTFYVKDLVDYRIPHGVRKYYRSCGVNP